MRTLLALALIGAGAWVGLTGRPLSGSTLAAVALIGAGGAWAITLYARKDAR